VSPRRNETGPAPGGESVGWGVLGWGDIARRAFVPALEGSASGHLVAIASERGDPVAIGREAPAARVHAGDGAYEDLLTCDDVDAVYVAVPNHRHAELTEAAAAAGKHVLCEKPLAVDSDEAERMASRCAQQGVLLMEAVMARFNPQHARVRDLIADGAIGQPRLFRASFTVSLRDPDRNVRFLPEPGAGALFDVGFYGISAARWTFGEEPEAVEAMSLNLAGTSADEIAVAVLRFGTDRLAAIDCGLTLEPRNVYEVVGSEGAIRVDRPFASPPFVPARPRLELTVTRGGRGETEASEDLNQYELQLDAFNAALLGAAPHPYPPQESIRTARVIDACRAAWERGVRTP
jgi:D-xylose 1-dehydrogenase (NADP+, D-xylono-1,5-lactone-forming)